MAFRPDQRRWAVAIAGAASLVLAWVLFRPDPGEAVRQCILDHITAGMSESRVGFVIALCGATTHRSDEPTLKPTAGVVVEDLSVDEIAKLNATLAIVDGLATLEVTNTGEREVTGFRVRTYRPEPGPGSLSRAFAGPGPFGPLDEANLHVHVLPRHTEKVSFRLPRTYGDPTWKWEIVQASGVVGQF